MGRIVAIGGGDIAARETLAIDREVVALTGAARPRALFIPTASGDSRDYWHAFDDVYGRELGCETDVLYLLGVNPTAEELEERILGSDLVYVGGGNTLKMMRRWRRLGVDRVLEEAYGRGVVLSGLSAGCICWFSWGHSDSMASYHPDDWSYIRVRGMGLLDALACPHFDSATKGVPRRADFEAMMGKHRDVGIGIDDCCAIEVVDDTYRVITSRPGAGAYRLVRRGRDLSVTRVEQQVEYQPIEGLLRAD